LGIAAMMLCAVTTPGCGGPNRANVELRRELQQQEERIAQLQRDREADRSTIRALQSERGTVPTLPQERLDELFTVVDISIGRLTGGADTNLDQPGDEALRVYIRPIDSNGDPIKASSRVEIELFELEGESRRIGSWSAGPDELRVNWISFGLVQDFVLTFPWQTAPTREQLVVRVVFTDLLTGRQFEKHQPVTVKLP
jgi:hypothetical protein